MGRNVWKIKRQLLQRISLEDYKKLLGFIEDIVLDDSDVKILLARKLSSLFLALVGLVFAEDDGRVRKAYEEKFSKGRRRPLIVSDRALDWVLKNVEEDFRYLIIDDMVVHGRSSYQVYKVLKEAVGDDSKIDIWGLAAVEGEMLSEQVLQDKMIIKKNYATCDWRKLSDEIVAIFFMAGQPYTSYIPTFRFEMKAEEEPEADRFFNGSGFYELNEPEQPMKGIHAYVWVPDAADEYSLFSCIRFYVNKPLGEIIMVPFVELMPVEKHVLERYMQNISGLFLDSFGGIDGFGGEFHYRMLTYTLSALQAFRFMKEFRMPVSDKGRICIEEEQLHFGTVFFDAKKAEAYSLEDIEAVESRLADCYEPVDSDEIFSRLADSDVLQSCIRNVTSTAGQTEKMEILEQFLHETSIIDQTNWQERGKTAVPKRVIGYPMAALWQWLDEFEIKKPDKIGMFISTADLGRGSMVITCLKRQNAEEIFLTVLHAGEQNYKYIEKKYFPYIYGLYMIEREALINYRQVDWCRQQFHEKYWNNKEYNAAEVAYLDGLNVTRDFKTVLLRDAIFCEDGERLLYATKLAGEITREQV